MHFHDCVCPRGIRFQRISLCTTLCIWNKYGSRRNETALRWYLDRKKCLVCVRWILLKETSNQLEISFTRIDAVELAFGRSWVYAMYHSERRLTAVDQHLDTRGDRVQRGLDSLKRLLIRSRDRCPADVELKWTFVTINEQVYSRTSYSSGRAKRPSLSGIIDMNAEKDLQRSCQRSPSRNQRW